MTSDRLCRYQGAIIDEGRILLIEHRVLATGRGYWVPPGGGLESPESEEECVRREMREETGLEVEVVRLLLTDDLPSEAPYRQAKTFLCRVVSGIASPGAEPEHEQRESYDIAAVAWVPLGEVDAWPAEMRTDPHTASFLHRVRGALGIDDAG